MNKEQIEKEVKELLADALCEDVKHIFGDTNLYDDLGMDSLDAVEIVMELEEKFNIEIADDYAVPCKTVQDIIDMVVKVKGD